MSKFVPRSQKAMMSKPSLKALRAAVAAQAPIGTEAAEYKRRKGRKLVEDALPHWSEPEKDA